MTQSEDRAEARDGEGGPGHFAHAFLAGGRRRVVECAVVSLVEQGALSLRAARLRPTGDVRPGHAIEQAVLAACPRSRRVQDVLDAAARSQAVDDLARRLADLGLLSRRRQRPTRAGRRLLAAAAAEESLPPYVRHGPAALAPGPVRQGLLGGDTVPDGLGRALRRMGKALDDDHGRDADGTGEGASGGGFGCGGSSGGGD
ncbi:MULTISPECIES: TIGR04222 domain-containing membrane protein [Streptomyces]|uniref:TIGR04222 domain-containing membrane protein n=1 Tax=Streptomyces TaxID=1883 RepID=UPI00087ED048|nr:TIGR04222 domain-containing membrane protein [Streptomyces sp. LaPpAH-199]MYW79748.1 TIGR04222 domain-containing membrane protein [Streptomyces sp. SID8369]SDD53576.1 TIGR04222 domain-containing protein [Streptomyces sp. LaPpAH-199]